MTTLRDNVRRARVHREGGVLVVVWNGGVSPLYREAVNAESWNWQVALVGPCAFRPFKDR
jgi:hypothetical protein